MAKGKYQEWLTDDGLLLLSGWARSGLTDEQIAKNMGIRRETLYDWIKKYSNISNALKVSKEAVDLEVENALLKRAKGYTTEEVKTIYQRDKDTGEMVEVQQIRTKKEVPPDTTAQIFWLKNRNPDAWREKKEIEATVTSNEAVADVEAYINGADT